MQILYVSPITQQSAAICNVFLPIHKCHQALLLSMFKSNLQCVLLSPADIQDHTSHLLTMSAVYMSLTCFNLCFCAVLEVQTDTAQWNASIIHSSDECSYNLSRPDPCHCHYTASHCLIFLADTHTS